MQTITTGSRQCMLDLAMQLAGSAEAALAMCLQNNLPITAELSGGTVLIAPVVVDADVVTVFKAFKARPASIVQSPGVDYSTGIGYWIIENDFIVQ